MGQRRSSSENRLTLGRTRPAPPPPAAAPAAAAAAAAAAAGVACKAWPVAEAPPWAAVEVPGEKEQVEKGPPEPQLPESRCRQCSGVVWEPPQPSPPAAHSKSLLESMHMGESGAGGGGSGGACAAAQSTAALPPVAAACAAPFLLRTLRSATSVSATSSCCMRISCSTSCRADVNQTQAS